MEDVRFVSWITYHSSKVVSVLLSTSAIHGRRNISFSARYDSIVSILQIKEEGSEWNTEFRCQTWIFRAVRQDGDIQQYSLRTQASEKTSACVEMSLKYANRTVCLFAYQSPRISSNSSCRWCVDPEGMRKDVRAGALTINNTCKLNLPVH